VNIKIWNDLGTYKSIQDLDLPIYTYYQKSGDNTFTHKGNSFSIFLQLYWQLERWHGVDSIHASLRSNHLSDTEDELCETVRILTDGNVAPALSYGLTAELMQLTVSKFIIDWLSNGCGGSFEDPDGTVAGIRKIRVTVDRIKP